MKVEISNAAAADLADIWSYGADQFGLELADAYGAEFEAVFALIGKYPLIGSVHEAIRPPIRSFP